MPSSENRALGRVIRESSLHIACAKFSNMQSADHVEASRRLIKRSFRLLSVPYHRLFE